MEQFLQVLGGIGFVLLVIIGLLAGWIAGKMTGGRHMASYLLLGVLAAVLTPFVLAVLGVSVLAAGGLLAILVAAAFGALLVLVLARMIFK
jgi:uncharacterized membrane protein YeaQ/YmgE (transglycosylase-associated protein family)